MGRGWKDASFMQKEKPLWHFAYAYDSRGGKNVIVMCETYKYNKEPTETNHRKVGGDLQVQQGAH